MATPADVADVAGGILASLPAGELPHLREVIAAYGPAYDPRASSGTASI